MFFLFPFLLLILFGAHYFLYFSVIRFSPAIPKTSLGIVLFFLSISFFVASFLAHWNDNILTRSLSWASGFWWGFLTNLVLACFVIWIIIGVGRLLSINANRMVIVGMFFSLAFLYSLYGVWNARHPQIKNISVTIPNLPAEWKDKKIVQLSDVHLGILGREKFLEYVVAKVNSVEPEIIVITGDMFDGLDGNLATLAGLMNTMEAKKGIYFVTGNHETYVGLDEVFSTLGKTKIKILEDEVADVSGLKLIGISYPERGEDKNVVRVLNSLKEGYAGQPNILLYHSPVQIDEIRESGVNLELCGHTHKGQIFPFGFVTKYIYDGYDYGLFKLGDYALYTTSGTGSWALPMRTGNRPEIAVITLE